MNEVQKMENKAALIDYIKEQLEPFGVTHFQIDDETVQIKPYTYDDRINWDTHMVTLKDYGVIGFTDGDASN